MALAGELEIRMFAEVSRLSRDMSEAKGMVGGAMKNIESSVNFARTALGALGVTLSINYFKNLIQGSIDAMDKLHDLSKSTGLTVEQLSGLKMAAQQSGGDLDSIAKSINKLSLEMGKAPDKFLALGISARDPLEAFKQLSDIFVSIESPQERAALAATALGKAWQGAAPLLAEGSRRIAEQVELGTRLSGITGKMTDQADKYKDQMVELNTALDGVKNTIAIALLPQLVNVTKAMSDAAREGKGFWATMLSGWQAFATGTDLQKSDKELVQLTDKLLKAENDLANARARGWKIQEQTFAAEVKALNERIKLIQGYRSLLEAAPPEVKMPKGGLKKQSFEDEGGGRFIKTGGFAGQDSELSAFEIAKQNMRAQEEGNLAVHQEYGALLVRLTQKNAEERTRIELAAGTQRQKFARMTLEQQAKDVFGYMADITAGVSQHNRALFEINKVAGIASAIINAYEGISLTLAKYPYPLNIGLAALHAAAAFAQVSAIAGTSFGSGGGAPSLAGGTPATPVTPVTGGTPQGGPTTILNLHGEKFDRKAIKALIEQINEGNRDGGRIVVT